MMAVVFGLVSFVAWFSFDKVLVWAIVLTIAFVVVGQFWPWVLLPLNRLWSRFAARIGVVSNYLILGIVFYGVFWPVAFFFRLIHRDLMCRKFEPEAQSYLTPVERQMNAQNIEDMY